MFAARQITRPRSGPGTFFQSWNATLAASIACATSSAVAAGNSAITSVGSAGLTLRTCSRESGKYQRPLTNDPVRAVVAALDLSAEILDTMQTSRTPIGCVFSNGDHHVGRQSAIP